MTGPVAAGDAEAACVAGEAERATHLATRLATQLQRLQQNATPFFMAARTGAEEVALADEGELDPQVLAGLVGLLRQQSLSATDRFHAVSPQLRRHLSKVSYELVRDHIDNLQFSDAATVLEASPNEARD